MWATPVLPGNLKPKQTGMMPAAYRYVGGGASSSTAAGRSSRKGASNGQPSQPATLQASTQQQHHHYPEYPAYEPIVSAAASKPRQRTQQAADANMSLGGTTVTASDVSAEAGRQLDFSNLGASSASFGGASQYNTPPRSKGRLSSPASPLPATPLAQPHQRPGPSSAAAPLRTPSPDTPARPLPTMTGGPLAGLTPSPSRRRSGIDAAVHSGDDDSSGGSSLSVLHAARNGFEQSGAKLDREMERLHSLVNGDSGNLDLLGSSFFRLQHVLPLVPSYSIGTPPSKQQAMGTPQKKRAEDEGSMPSVTPTLQGYAAILATPPRGSAGGGGKSSGGDGSGKRSSSTPPILTKGKQVAPSAALGATRKSAAAYSAEPHVDPLESYLAQLPGYPWVLGADHAQPTTTTTGGERRASLASVSAPAAASPPAPIRSTVPVSPLNNGRDYSAVEAPIFSAKRATSAPRYVAVASPASPQPQMPTRSRSPEHMQRSPMDAPSFSHYDGQADVSAPTDTQNGHRSRSAARTPAAPSSSSASSAAPSVWKSTYDAVFPHRRASNGSSAVDREEDFEKTRLLLLNLQRLRNIEETQRYVSAGLPSVATAGLFAWARHQALVTTSPVSGRGSARGSRRSSIVGGGIGSAGAGAGGRRGSEDEVRTPPYPWQGMDQRRSSRPLSAPPARGRSTMGAASPSPHRTPHYSYGYPHSHREEEEEAGMEGRGHPLTVTFAPDEEHTLESIRNSGRGQLSAGAAVAAMEAFSTVAAPEHTVASGLMSSYSAITTPSATASYSSLAGNGYAGVAPIAGGQSFMATRSSQQMQPQEALGQDDEESTAGMLSSPSSFSFAAAAAMGSSLRGRPGAPPTTPAYVAAPAVAKAVHQNPLRALLSHPPLRYSEPNHYHKQRIEGLQAQTDYGRSAKEHIFSPYEKAQDGSNARATSQRRASQSSIVSPPPVFTAAVHAYEEEDRPRSPWRGQYASAVRCYYPPHHYQRVERTLSPKRSAGQPQPQQQQGSLNPFSSFAGQTSPLRASPPPLPLARGYLGSLLSGIATSSASGHRSSHELEEVKAAWAQQVMMGNQHRERWANGLTLGSTYRY